MKLFSFSVSYMENALNDDVQLQSQNIIMMTMHPCIICKVFINLWQDLQFCLLYMDFIFAYFIPYINLWHGKIHFSDLLKVVLLIN